MKSFLLPILIFIVFSCPLMGQKLHDKIPFAHLLKDLELLERNLRKVHPGLHTYHSPRSMDSIFKKYRSMISRDMTSMEFYQKVGTLINLIGDAHTEIEPNEAFYDSLNTRWKVFPLSTVWLDKRLFVIEDFSDEKLSLKGKEIVAINGVSSNEIFRHIRQYVPRDGYNLTSPNHTLSGIFGQFRNYYASIYGHPESFNVVVRDNGKNEKNISVRGLKYRRIFDKYDNANTPKKPSQEPLQFTIQEGVGILKVRSFHPGQIREAGQNFKKFFKRTFKQIFEQGVQQLVIDIRKNGGGHESVFMELFSHLTDKPFFAYKELSTVTVSVPDKEYYLEQDEISYLERWSKKNLKKIGSKYYSLNEAGTRKVIPNKNAFSGNLMVLIDGRTSSAAGDFSGLIKSYDRATFIGEETGGNPYENNAGTRLTLVLPYSGLQIIIPTLKYVINYNKKNDGRGVYPDHKVNLTIEDLLGNRDKTLGMALKLLKEQR
ncbi:MAG: S41 family peptidase [Bacteroidota bacterium]